MSELHFLSIAEASRLVRSRKLSPVELTQAHLARIREFDGSLAAFITLTEDLAIKQARRAEREIEIGRAHV